MKPHEIAKCVREKARLHKSVDGIPQFLFQGIHEGMWMVYHVQDPSHEQVRSIYLTLKAMNDELKEWYVKQDPERVKSLRGIEKGIGHIRVKYQGPGEGVIH